MYELNQIEEEYMEIEVPECWPYHDKDDLSCTRWCLVREYCEAEQEASRAPCFGLMWSDDNEECSRCLQESQCVEIYEKLLRGDGKMAKTRVRRIRTRPPKAEEPEVEEEELEEEPEEETKPTPKKVVRKKVTPKPEPEPEPEDDKGFDYASMSIPALRKELKDRGLDSTGRKAGLIQRLMADDAGEEEEEEPEEEAPKKRPTRKVSRRIKEVEEPEEEAQADVVASLGQFMDSLPTGAVVTAIRVDEDTFQFSFGGEVVAVATTKGRHSGLSGKEFEQEAYSPAYLEWYYEDGGIGKGWGGMSPEERYAYAEEIDAKWEEHENEKTDAMRMSMAVRESLGIEKWRPEYESRAARRALKDDGIRAA